MASFTNGRKKLLPIQFFAFNQVVTILRRVVSGHRDKADLAERQTFDVTDLLRFLTQRLGTEILSILVAEKENGNVHSLDSFIISADKFICTQYVLRIIVVNRKQPLVFTFFGSFGFD